MQQDIPVSPARVELLEGMEPQAQWAHKDLRVTLELLVPEPQENQVRTALPVCPDLWELKVLKVQLVSQVHPECQALAKPESPESPAAEELLVPPEPQDRKESPAPLASLVTQVPQVQLAPLVHKVQEDSRAKEVQLGPKVTSVWWEPQAQEEPRVNKELRDSQESPVPPEQ